MSTLIQPIDIRNVRNDFVVPVEEVSRAIARSLDGYKVVVEKSTVPVLTHDWVRKVMLMNGAPPGSFDVASNPEFLREGSAVRDFLYPDRIVLGVGNERSSEVLHQIYEPLASGRYYQDASRVPGPAEPRIPPIIVTSPKSAELIKHASNAFLATKVSFINAVANVCEAVSVVAPLCAPGMVALMLFVLSAFARTWATALVTQPCCEGYSG